MGQDTKLIVRRLGLADYRETWCAMRDFTAKRQRTTEDELWLLEHPPVYTMGRAGRREHLLNPGNIPVVHVDRGGQVTYHGPGQLVVYLLLDIRRRKLGVKSLVESIESALVDTLANLGIDAAVRTGAPGVYVRGAKLASIGLRVRNGCTYHGLALNLNLDLTPFRGIDPCGYRGLQVTRIADLLPACELPSRTELENNLVGSLCNTLGYTRRACYESVGVQSA